MTAAHLSGGGRLGTVTFFTASRNGNTRTDAETWRAPQNEGHKLAIRIVIADDNMIFREMLRILLEREQDFAVIGEAYDGYAAVKLAIELIPDIVLMDVSMKGLNGIQATKQIIFNRPTAKIIGFSMHSATQFVTAMFSAGARGYLLKDAGTKELKHGIRTVANGDVYIAKGVATGEGEEEMNCQRNAYVTNNPYTQ